VGAVDDEAWHNRTGRSKGEARHIRLYHWLLASPAWRSLKPVERAAYVDIASRYAGHGSNKALQERGFIVLTKRGAFSLKLRHATEWRRTEFPCDVTHAVPSKDFMRWQEIQKTVLVTLPSDPPSVTVAPTTSSKNPEHGFTTSTPLVYQGVFRSRPSLTP
jgi:hypothetical protein